MASPRNRNSNEPRRSGGAHPPWLLLVLVIPIAGWVVFALLPWVEVASPDVRRFCRDLGYASLAALGIPYLYVWRRLSLHRRYGSMTRWMQVHIAAAYLGFGLMVVHARGHLFRGGLTCAIVILFAVVLLSGIFGMLLQKTVFRLISVTLDEELGLERLHGERQRLIEQSGRLVANYSMLTETDIHDWRGFCALLADEKSKVGAAVWKHKMFPQTPWAIIQSAVASKAEPEEKNVLVAALNDLLRTPEFCRSREFEALKPQGEAAELGKRSPKEMTDSELERRNRLYLELACPEHIAKSKKPPESVGWFFEAAVAGYLRSEFPSWRWLFHPSAREPISENQYVRVRALADPDQAGMIKQLWDWVERRRRMDLEYWLQRLARSWLWVHGLAAWPLLVLFHVFWSLYYGGFF